VVYFVDFVDERVVDLLNLPLPLHIHLMIGTHTAEILMLRLHSFEINILASFEYSLVM
jgi:hypothetical protein